MNEAEKRYEHLCPTHGWETCGTAASLIDPHNPDAEHGCSRWRNAIPPPFRAETREVPS